MNPITYNDEDILLQSTKYQSNRPTTKKKKISNTGQINKKMNIKRKSSSNFQIQERSSKNNNSYKQTAKNRSCKTNERTSVLCTPTRSPQEISSRNKNYETEIIHTLAQKTTQQLYIRDLQQKNIHYLNTIHLLQQQLNQKDRILDQCQSQISFLKQKFTQIFNIYHQQMRKVHQKKSKSPNLLDQANQRLKNSKISEEEHQIMRRIEYSEDTLTLSQASSSINILKQSNHNDILQESTILIPKPAEFQFFDTINDSLNQNQLQIRAPLQNIENNLNFSKVKNNEKQKTIKTTSEKENQKILSICSQVSAESKPPNKNQGQTLGSRKQSLSAITATHRLAAFYHKRIQ